MSNVECRSDRQGFDIIPERDNSSFEIEERHRYFTLAERSECRNGFGRTSFNHQTKITMINTVSVGKLGLRRDIETRGLKFPDRGLPQDISVPPRIFLSDLEACSKRLHLEKVKKALIDSGGEGRDPKRSN